MRRIQKTSKKETKRRRDSFGISAIGDPKFAEWVYSASDEEINERWEKGLEEIKKRKQSERNYLHFFS